MKFVALKVLLFNIFISNGQAQQRNCKHPPAQALVPQNKVPLQPARSEAQKTLT
jgi:hypothetical protein